MMYQGYFWVLAFWADLYYHKCWNSYSDGIFWWSVAGIRACICCESL